MQIDGITFVGTRTEARLEMAEFVRDVLGLDPVRVDGIDAEVFAMPDGSSFAVTSPDRPDDIERTVEFLVADIEQAARELWAAGVEMDGEIASSTRQRYLHSAHRTAICTSWSRKSNAADERRAAKRSWHGRTRWLVGGCLLPTQARGGKCGESDRGGDSAVHGDQHRDRHSRCRWPGCAGSAQRDGSRADDDRPGNCRPRRPTTTWSRSIGCPRRTRLPR